MLDKAKILERINSTLYFTPCNPFEDGKDYALTELKEEIDSGTFDAPLTEESQEQHSSLADSRMMTITKFAWDEKVEQVRQLREENERLKEIDERECTIAISLKRERDELVKERNKLVKALETIAYKNMGGGEAGYASIILSEIKGQGENE